jgi:predicted nucleic acid-binding protein
MIALDSNLLIYAHRGMMPEHSAACRAIEQAVAHPQGWGIPLPCLTEFWSVVTHPKATGVPALPEIASQFLINLLEDGGGILLQPNVDFGKRLIQIAVELKITGRRIFDLQIALIAFENGATELWSHDRNFVGVPGLIVLDPLEEFRS